MVADAQKLAGGDLSLVPAYEAAGDVWLDADGKSINNEYTDGIITFFKEVAGWNSVRVRLMVDPSADSYVATCQDMEYVANLGKRIKAAGMTFLLDIFYSDTWTDVSSQWMPSSWGFTRSTPTSTVAAKVKTYTEETLNLLAASGASPDYVQLGNEVSYGMLWDSAAGSSKSNAFYTSGNFATYKSQIERFAQLLNAGAEGVRSSKCAKAKIVLHCERTASADQTIDFYDWVGQAGFSDYDVIGLSYYPQWHGDLAKLSTTLKDLSNTFEDKEIQIVETGYFNNANVATPTYDTSSTWPFSPAGQASFLKDLIKTLSQYENVTGIYYWQPEECGNGADSDGNSRVMDGWDNRGFWELTWKSGSHRLQSNDALMSLKTFVDGNDVPETTTDITSQFENTDFQTCEYYAEGGYITTCPSWDINYDNPWSNGPWPVVVNEWHSSLVDGYCLQGWNAAGNSLSSEIILSMFKDNMPAGSYTVTAAIHTDNAGMVLFANDAKTAVTPTSEWGTAYEIRVTASLSETGPLTFGLKFDGDVDTSSDINLYADNFKVFYSDLSSGITELSESKTNSDGWFDLSGRKLNSRPSQKGVYIFDGKKYMVK